MTTLPTARTVFLSPTEHDLKRILPDAIYSSLCEANGCDILALTSRGFLGIQRKTLADLEQSFRDGRLSVQIAQLHASTILCTRLVVIELDRTRITTDGKGFIDSSLTVAGLRTLAFKLFLNDAHYIESSNIGDTCSIIEGFASYLERDRADLLIRPKPGGNAWGTRSNRDWGVHILQSFPGIGPRTAGLIYDTLGVPFKWTVTEKDLTAIPGIGRTTAQRLLSALGEGESAPA
jgi:ERCC4-type nuclease